MGAFETLVVTFRVGHILSAIVWLGLIYFMAFVRPRVMMGLPEDTRRQVLPHLARYIAPWMLWSSIGTMVFGAALYTTLGTRIGFANMPMGLNIGVFLAVVMFLLGGAFAFPFLYKAARTLEGGTPPGPDELRRMGVVAKVNVVLSLLVVFFMVSSQRIAFLS